MQRHRATSHTDIPRTALRHPFAWGIACGLAVLFAALAYAGMGRASAAAGDAGTDYTHECGSGAVSGTFSFSPSPSTDSFTVRLTYHIPGSATFVAVPGASTDFPAGTTSPVSFSFSTANVPPDANTIRFENTLNTSKSVSFTCPGVTAPTETPTTAPTNTPPANTNTPGPSATSVPPTATTVPSTATNTPTSGGGASTATPTTPAGAPISAAATPTRVVPVNTVLAASTSRPTGTLALPNTGAAGSSGSSNELMFGAALIALVSVLTGGAGLVLRRRSTGDRS